MKSIDSALKFDTQVEDIIIELVSESMTVVDVGDGEATMQLDQAKFHEAFEERKDELREMIGGAE